MKLLGKILILTMLGMLLTGSVRAETCCQGRVGDANGSGDEPTLADISMIIALFFLYDGIVPPEWMENFCWAEVDVNQSGGLNPSYDDVTLGDLSVVIEYLFIKGPYSPTNNPSGTILPDCLDQQSGPTGYAVSSSGCKSYGALSESGASSTTCLRYTYDGVGTLTMTHVNAGMNCCPVPTFRIEVEGDTITIIEQDHGLCDCNCLFDIDYVVVDLPPGYYRINVAEAIQVVGDPLDFWTDLTYERTDEFCVARGSYPWGDEIAALPVSHTGCLSGDMAAQSSTAPLDQSCIEYSYDGSAGVLSITHQNAAFNCCPGYFGLAVSVDGNTVTITETDELGPYPCHCLCLYDFTYEVINLPPGGYDFVIVEPYTDPGSELTFTADLTAAPGGEACVTRDYYPWGDYGAQR